MARKIGWMQIVWLAAMCLMVGCSKEIDVTAFDDQAWQVNQTFRYNPGVMPSVGGSIEGIDLSVDTGGLTEEFMKLGMDQLKYALGKKEIRSSWSHHDEGRESVYSMQLQGNGWDKLQDYGLGGKVQELATEIQPNGNYQADSYMQMMTDLNGAVKIEPLANHQVHLEIIQSPSMQGVPSFGMKFRLRAGQIISSNANSQFLGTATWDSPTNIDVVFVPMSHLTPALVTAGAVVGGSVVVGVCWLIYQLFSRPRRPLARRLSLRPQRRRTVRRLR